MKRLSVAVIGLTLLFPSGAAALSCAEPPPFDMAAAISESEAAAIGTVVSVIERNKDQNEDADLYLMVDIQTVFKGEMRHRIFLHRSTSVWGPTYSVGHTLAILANDGIVDDGRNRLCPPFYDEQMMLDAGFEGTTIERPATTLGTMAYDAVRVAALIASTEG